MQEQNTASHKWKGYNLFNKQPPHNALAHQQNNNRQQQNNNRQQQNNNRQQQNNNRQQQPEIQLTFHHPNLLFLNDNRYKSKDEQSREMEEYIVRNINTRKERRMDSQEYNTRRPKTTAHLFDKSISKVTTIPVYTHKTNSQTPTISTNSNNDTMERMQVFGRSANAQAFLFNKQDNNNTAGNSKPKPKSNKKTLKKRRCNMFDILSQSKKEGKMQLWRTLLMKGSKGENIDGIKIEDHRIPGKQVVYFKTQQNNKENKMKGLTLKDYNSIKLDMQINYQIKYKQLM